MSAKKGNFQPAKLDVDSSLIDSQLSFVPKENDDFDQIFSQMNKGSKIETLLPEEEYASVTVYPKQGLCVKTRNTKGGKFFVNLCRVDEIPAPTPMKEDELERMIAEEDYSNLWKVPMSIGAPRKEKDKSGGECFAADVAVNSHWFQATMEPSPIFTAFVITVAIEGLGDKYGEEARLERDSWTILKNKKYLGDKAPPHSIQKRASFGIKPVISDSSKSTSKPVKSEKRTPQFKIEKNKKINPTEMRAEVFLPGVFNLRQIELSLGEDRLQLETKTGNFYLDIFLPININTSSAVAWFNNVSSVLHIKSSID